MGREICIRNRISRNILYCAKDNDSNMSNMCAKEFSDLNFNQTVNAKISIFQEIVLNFIFSQK